MSDAASGRGLVALWRHGRAHRRHLGLGGLAGLAVVGLRLLLPWTLHYAVTGDDRAHLLEGALAFAAAAVGLGLADHLARLWLARFAIGAVGDLREQVARRSADGDAHPGQRVARIIGDAARLKGGIKAVLVHGLTSTVILLGLLAILCALDVRIGAIFAVGLLALLLMIRAFASRTHRRAKRHREREGEVAEQLTEGGLPEHLLRGGRTSEASLTRLTGLATWGAYAIYGATVIGMLWLAAGTDLLLLVVLYGLMARGPIVRLTRQGCRVGKIAASLERLAALAPPAAPAGAPELAS